MHVRHHYSGKIYVIEFPPGSHVRRSELAGGSTIYVPCDWGEIPIFEEPPELLVEMAERSRYGLRIIRIDELDGT